MNFLNQICVKIKINTQISKTGIRQAENTIEPTIWANFEISIVFQSFDNIVKSHGYLSKILHLSKPARVN